MNVSQIDIAFRSVQSVVLCSRKARVAKFKIRYKLTSSEKLKLAPGRCLEAIHSSYPMVSRQTPTIEMAHRGDYCETGNHTADVCIMNT